MNMSQNSVLKIVLSEARRINSLFTRDRYVHRSEYLYPPKCTTSPIGPHRRYYGYTSSSKSEPPVQTGETAKDALFDMLKEQDGMVSVSKFLSALSVTGLRHSDPRLKEMKQRVLELVSPADLALDIADLDFPFEMRAAVGNRAVRMDAQEFRRVVESCMPLLSRAFRRRLALRDFADFCSRFRRIFERCKDNTEGQVASYIPQLALASTSLWAASVCSVDGQRFSIGDAKHPFTLQSISKPLTYALCLEHLGADVVHRYVGQEPSGRNFNELVLDDNKRPHNPMVNSGAIVVCSLLRELLPPKMSLAQKFDFTFKFIQKLAGNEALGFNNAVFVSERDAGDRNFALAFLMREYKCYPENTRLSEVLDLYFQCCSMETSCDSLAVMGATLANGGVCPLTEERVLGAAAVRDVLSLMHSCGMYDYSGQFAFKVGIPAKSGVSGGLIAVVPNVLGLACWSPPLDKLGNSARGLQFCDELVAEFGFHPYKHFRSINDDQPSDCLDRLDSSEVHAVQHTKMSPSNGNLRGRICHSMPSTKVTKLLMAARAGDLGAIRRHLLAGRECHLMDYDGRTALHVAAAEGQLEMVQFLLERCGFLASWQDRWGHIPIDEAKRSGHTNVVTILKDYANHLDSTQK